MRKRSYKGGLAFRCNVVVVVVVVVVIKVKDIMSVIFLFCSERGERYERLLKVNTYHTHTPPLIYHLSK